MSCTSKPTHAVNTHTTQQGQIVSLKKKKKKATSCSPKLAQWNATPCYDAIRSSDKIGRSCRSETLCHNTPCTASDICTQNIQSMKSSITYLDSSVCTRKAERRCLGLVGSVAVGQSFQRSSETSSRRRELDLKKPLAPLDNSSIMTVSSFEWLFVMWLFVALICRLEWFGKRWWRRDALSGKANAFLRGLERNLFVSLSTHKACWLAVNGAVLVSRCFHKQPLPSISAILQFT